MDTLVMLHERMLGAGMRETSATTDDRRASDRVPFPVEVILVWHCDTEHVMRYPVLDAGDGGYRIHSTLPMPEGMTGTILRLLTGSGAELNQPVMVAWCKPSDDDDGYDVGLRNF